MVPGRSELSSRQDWAAHRHLHVLLWDFPWLFALAGRGRQTLTGPFPLGLVQRSRGPWGGWAVIQGFVFLFHHQRVSPSPYHHWPLFLQGGRWGFWRSCLQKVLWARSGFPNPSFVSWVRISLSQPLHPYGSSSTVNPHPTGLFPVFCGAL